MTNEEKKKISYDLPIRHLKLAQSLGKSQTDFINTALDYYVLHIQDPYNKVILSEMQKWINKKKHEINSVETNIKILHDNTNILHDNTNILHDNTDVLEYNTDNMNVISKTEGNTIKTTDINLKNKLVDELPILRDLLNNPVNMDTVPDFTLKKLSKKYDVSKSYLQTWITQNKEWIKTSKFEAEQYE